MFLEHVNITVSDVERSAAFYADLLDMHVRWKGEIDGGRHAVHVGDDRCYLALFEATAAGPAPDPEYGAPGVNHFGFVVDDLDEAAARLARLGATDIVRGETPPGRRVYFRDLDNNEVELVSYA